ncbi:hypothetical protein Y032_0042g541 [Ancylostoma ceylanicum]|uniref:Uncharacterized protein n=1 Tax=Ancylostoma ceylanicum TaxID=53326 RepID=A0A016UG16_9BILA|nr:hypothetical protein Y032_0042g541 [Ancylostoma ceylanicum]
MHLPKQTCPDSEELLLIKSTLCAACHFVYRKNPPQDDVADNDYPEQYDDNNDQDQYDDNNEDNNEVYDDQVKNGCGCALVKQSISNVEFISVDLAQNSTGF